MQDNLQNNYITIGKKLKKLRVQAGLTQADLADALGCSTQHISRIENGRRTVHFDTFVRIARLFGISTEELLSSTAAQTFDPYITAISVRLQNCTEKEKRLFLELLKTCKQLMEQA